MPALIYCLVGRAPLGHGPDAGGDGDGASDCEDEAVVTTTAVATTTALAMVAPMAMATLAARTEASVAAMAWGSKGNDEKNWKTIGVSAFGIGL